MFKTKITTLSVLALIATAFLVIASMGAVAEYSDSQVVEITDNQSQEIVVDVEFLQNTNASLDLLENETGDLVESVELNGSADTWETEYFNVTNDGEYKVTLNADHSDHVGQWSVEISDENAGFLAGTAETTQYLIVAVALVFGVGLVYFREEINV